MMDRVYAIYARQSIDKADSISIETQIERCRAEVGSGKYRCYFDRGYSGKNTDRPQFQEMLDAVRNGEICCVVCYKLDRCSRSVLDFTQLMHILQQNGVGFISCTEKFDTTTPMGRAMLNICIVFAQLERETIQERIRDAYHSRCKKGYFMGGRSPFGFSLSPYLLEGKKTSCYTVVEQEANIMKQIYFLYQKPNASLADVVQGLQELQIANPKRTDGLWVRPHLARMVKNPIYVRADQRIFDYFMQKNTVIDNPREDFVGYNGCYLYNLDDVLHLVLAPHEGIISSEIWLRCQKGSSKPRNTTGNRQKSWLYGKIRCQKCGRTVTQRQSIGRNGQIYRYFVCSGSRGNGSACEGFHPFSVLKTEQGVQLAIQRRIQNLAAAEPADITKETFTAGLEALLGSLPEASTAAECIGQLEQLIHGFRVSHEPVRPDWSILFARIAQWENYPQEKKAKIASLMIQSVDLGDGKVSIRWRV